MKVSLKIIILIIFSYFHVQSYGQLTLDDIKLDQIKQRKIRVYIKNRIEDNKHLFSEIHPSCNKNKDLMSYSKNEMTFCLNGKIQDIWQGYISANPSKSWNGRKVSFGLLLQKFPESIFYDHDSMMGVDTGQVYFLNLKILQGMYNLPVAFEIIKVDTVEKVFEFSYIEGNKSSGIQQIKFIDMGGERIKILHTSYFKSDSHFRDKWLYPFFHKKIVNDFHRNMKKLLNLEEAKNMIQ